MDSKPANCDVRGATLNKQAFRAFQRLPFQKDLAVACNAEPWRANCDLAHHQLWVGNDAVNQRRVHRFDKVALPHAEAVLNRHAFHMFRRTMHQSSLLTPAVCP